MAETTVDTGMRERLAGKIARVDAARATPWWRDRLAHRLDTPFEAASAATNIQTFRFWLIVLAFAQAFGLLRDAAFDMQQAGVLLRGAIALPVLIAVILALGMAAGRGKVGLLTSIAVLTPMCAQIGLAAASAQPFSDRYLMGVVFAFSIVHLLMPFTHRQIVVHGVLIGSILGIMAWACKVPGEADRLEVLLPAIILLASTGALIMRHNRRRAFLVDLRSALQADALAHANRSLARLLRQDTLTGVYNRRYFDETMDRLWRETEAEGRPLGLVLLDVDRFKSFNDRQGHQAGDTCLKAVAACLSVSLRDSDFVVARYGGEEFAVILPGVRAADAYAIGERLRAAVESLAWPHPAGGCVTMSIGTAACKPDTTGRYYALVDAADSALYASKEAGRNRVTAGFITSACETPLPCETAAAAAAAAAA